MGSSLDVGAAVKRAAQPNYLISILIGLIILALINGFLPDEYKVGKYIAGLFA